MNIKDPFHVCADVKLLKYCLLDPTEHYKVIRLTQNNSLFQEFQDCLTFKTSH